MLNSLTLLHTWLRMMSSRWFEITRHASHNQTILLAVPCVLLQILLLVTYSILLLYVLVQIIFLFVRRHKKLSFHMFFLIICTLWIIIRLTYFIRGLVPHEYDYPSIWIALSWLGMQLQWVMFSFLFLFHIRLLYGTQWPELRTRAFILYVIPTPS